MIGYRLSERGRSVRQVTVAEDLAITVEEEEGDYFPLQVVSPQSAESVFDGSPRENAARSRLVYEREQDLAVADRVEVYDGETWELLTDPRPVRNAGHVTGYEVEALPVDVLYPREADVERKDGDAVDTVALAVFQPDPENSTERGTYGGYRAEAPIEFAETLDERNLVAVLEKPFNITSCTPNYEVPHVALELREVKNRQAGS